MEHEKNNNIPLFILLGLVALLFLYLLKPFFFPIFWAAVIAGIFQPLYQRINRRLNRATLSTAIIILVFAVIILLPLGIVASLTFNESVQLYGKLNPNAQNIDSGFQHMLNVIANNPLTKLFNVNEAFLSDKAAQVVRSIMNYILTHLTDLTQNTLAFLVQFAIMIYTLFYFVRDGDKFLKTAMRILPLGMGRERFLYDRFFVTARSTLKVTLIIGGIQGMLGGIIFYITNIEGALIWGLLMILMAIVPVVGCTIIWGPAGILMLITGHIWEGVLILAFGGVVISMIDNFLRPILIGKDVEMHPLMIFLSTLGGIVLFGFSGFVIGPIIASLLIAIWDMFDEFYRKE